jgi:Integral membrane protein (PIN domain superfamily)
MKKFILKTILLFVLIGSLGTGFVLTMLQNFTILWQIAAGGTAGLLICWLALVIWRGLRKGWTWFDRWLDNTSVETLLGGTVGLIVGIFVGLLGSYPFSVIRGAGAYMALVFVALCAYLGMLIGSRRAAEIWRLVPVNAAQKPAIEAVGRDFKVLDTSAIIDGRIYDVCQSKFLEGTLMVPVFVIEELQHIADSSDNLRRSKGRRGLELLSKMQKDSSIKIQIVEDNIAEEKEVDMKLVRLCKKIGANIITNDYNLNKVAELQGIKVLNINELANAVKVVVYPGETMYINILKEGKEPGQGVGYLEDGTMVVVEDAQDELGNNLEVLVTSVFQTAAGRMIFSRKMREENNLGIYKPNLPGGPIQEVNVYG